MAGKNKNSKKADEGGDNELKSKEAWVRFDNAKD